MTNAFHTAFEYLAIRLDMWKEDENKKREKRKEKNFINIFKTIEKTFIVFSYRYVFYNSFHLSVLLLVKIVP